MAPRSAGSGSLVEDEGAVAAEIEGEGAASGASGDSAGGDSAEEAGGAGGKEVLVWVWGCCVGKKEGWKDGWLVLVVGRESKAPAKGNETVGRRTQHQPKPREGLCADGVQIEVSMEQELEEDLDVVCQKLGQRSSDVHLLSGPAQQLNI